MSKNDLASIFNLKFYRKQKKWRFVRKNLSDNDHSTEPECSQSARSLLNQTYDVHAAEFPKPVDLDDAFIDSANGADHSSEFFVNPGNPGAGDPPPSPRPLDDVTAPSRRPLDLTFSQLDLGLDLDLGFDLGLQKGSRYPDDVTDYPHYDVCRDPRYCRLLRVDKLYGYTADICDKDHLYAPPVDEYIDCIAPRDMDRDIWRDRNLAKPEDECIKGWPQQSAIWTNTGDHVAPEHWVQMYNEAARDLQCLNDFMDEERLLTEAQDLLRNWDGRGGTDQKGGTDEWGASDNLLLDKLTSRRDRLLASGGACLCPPSPPSPPLQSPRSSLDTLDTLDSDQFTRGAHAAPHSSETELCLDMADFDGDSSSWRVEMSRHARALHALLSRVRRASASASDMPIPRPSSSRSAHDPANLEEFPTRDVGPLPPLAPPFYRPSPPLFLDPSFHRPDQAWCLPEASLYPPEVSSNRPYPSQCRPDGQKPSSNILNPGFCRPIQDQAICPSEASIYRPQPSVCGQKPSLNNPDPGFCRPSPTATSASRPDASKCSPKPSLNRPNPDFSRLDSSIITCSPKSSFHRPHQILGRREVSDLSFCRPEVSVGRGRGRRGGEGGVVGLNAGRPYRL